MWEKLLRMYAVNMSNLTENWDDRGAKLFEKIIGNTATGARSELMFFHSHWTVCTNLFHSSVVLAVLLLRMSLP